MSDVEETWCQLGRILSLDRLVEAGDGLICRKSPPSTLEDLTETVLHWVGRPGIPRAREALAHLRPRTDSPMETRLRLMIVRAGFPEPIVNHAIHDARGKFLGFGDLCYPDQLVVIEYDGGQHREDEEQYHHDIERLDAFMANGWRVIRVNKSLLARPADLYSKLRVALMH